MESMFKFLFGFAIFIYSLVSVGVFLLIIKIILMFTPQVNILGLTIF